MTGPLRWLYLKLTERLYTEWAAVYDPVSALVSAGQWGRWRESALAFVDGEDVLEIGVGTGHLVSELSHTGRRAVGIDASPMMAARAARRQRASSVQALIVQGFAESLPFADSSFDTIVSTFPASYILDRRTASECARVVRSENPGSRPGRLVVVGLWVRTECSVLRALFLSFYGDPEWRTIGAYVAALRHAGFAPAVIERRMWRFYVGTVVAIRCAEDEPAEP